MNTTVQGSSVTSRTDGQSKSTRPNGYFQCNTCQRTGIPILPLRKVFTANALSSADWNYDDNKFKDSPRGQLPTPLCNAVDRAKERLRTLTEGYFYVLLEKRTGGAAQPLVIEGYTVNAQGHLRYFDPNDTPHGAPQPLATQCVKEMHDVMASYISVDVDTYKTAWMAFSYDPWPPSVIRKYKNREQLAVRFTEVDLDAIKASRNPVDPYALLKADDCRFLATVFDYSETRSDLVLSIDSESYAHRVNKLAANFEYVKNQIAKFANYNLQALAAIAVPDPVGNVLEANYMRQALLMDKKKWESEEKRFYLYATSLEIAKIRDGKAMEKIREKAASEVSSEINSQVRWEMLRSLPYALTTVTLPIAQYNAYAAGRTLKGYDTKEEAIRARMASVELASSDYQAIDTELEQYHHAMNHNGRWGRKRFNMLYSQWANQYIKTINAITEKYVEYFDSTLFQTAMEHDYGNDDPQDRRERESASRFTYMMTRCLEGGPSDLPEYDSITMDKSKSLDALSPKELKKTPSIDLWQRLQSGENGLFYKALYRRNQRLENSVKQAMSQVQRDQQAYLQSLRQIDYSGGDEKVRSQFEAARKELLINQIKVGMDVYKGVLASGDVLQHWHLDTRLKGAITSLMNTTFSATQQIGTVTHAVPATGVQHMQFAVLMYGNTPVMSTPVTMPVDQLKLSTQEMTSKIQLLDMLQRTGVQTRADFHVDPGALTDVTPRSIPQITTDLAINFDMMYVAKVEMSSIVPADILQSGNEARIKAAIDAYIDAHPNSFPRTEAVYIGNDSIGTHMSSQELYNVVMGDTLQAQQSGATQQNTPAGRTRTGEDIKAMGGVALGIGLEGVSLYFSLISFQKAAVEADRKLGAARAEAVLTLYSDMLGIAGSMLTITGSTMQGFLVWRYGAQASAALVSSGQGTLAQLSFGLKGFGGALSSVSSAINAYGTFVKVLHASENKELGRVVVYYSLAALCFTLAVGAVFIPVFGTVISIVLGIVGAILCIWGDADKRTLLQTWLDRCAFGKAAHCPNRYKKIEGYVYQWDRPEHLNTAIQAVRGAWMGLDPQVEVYEDVMYFYNSSTAMYWVTSVHAESKMTIPELAVKNPATTAYAYAVYLRRKNGQHIKLCEQSAGNVPIALELPAFSPLPSPGTARPLSGPVNNEPGFPARHVSGNPQQVVSRPFPVLTIDRGQDRVGRFKTTHRPKPDLINVYNVLDIDPDDMDCMVSVFRFWADTKYVNNYAQVQVYDTYR